jgi:transposase-like protein
MAANERSDKPTDYTPEACALVAKLMGSGHSLTGAAGAMGVSPETLRRWMDTHEEFRDAVSRGKAARVYALERRMLASENTAVVNACRFARDCRRRMSSSKTLLPHAHSDRSRP